MKVNCAHTKLVPISELKLNPRNPNKHGSDQIKRLAKILNYQGWRSPVKVSNRSGLVSAGHGRIAAALLNGWTHAPCDFQNYESEESEYQDLIADNAIASWAEQDLGMINVDIGQFGPDTDLELLGFKDFTVDVSEHGEGDGDDVPPTPKEAKTRRGELWTLGNHRLLIDDCTVAENVARLMGEEKADMVFTDPPYNIAQETENFAKDIRPNSYGKLDKSAWDYDFDFNVLIPRLEEILENGTVYITTSQFVAPKIFNWLIGWADFKSYCVWNKTNPMPSLMKRHWTWSSELVCYGTKGKHVFNFPTEGHAKSVWDFPSQTANREHPTQKPVDVPEHAILHSSNSGGLVADLFLGSGSTLIACEKTNRRCYGTEIEPLYADVILERFFKYAKIDPVREDGVTWSELNSPV